MKLPFPIRGTQEWNDREFTRYLQGHQVMSFGAVPVEHEGRNKYVPIRETIVTYLMEYGVPELRARQFAESKK